MNANDLTIEFWLNTISRYTIAMPNVLVDTHEWDICAVRKSGFIDEIEIKVTRSDFLADFKKSSQKRVPIPSAVSPQRHFTHWKYVWVPKHDLTAAGDRKCNYFWYLMPEQLADKCVDDIPEHAGLMVGYYNNRDELRIKQVKPAPRLHSRKDSKQNGFMYNLASKAVWRYWHTMRDMNNLRKVNAKQKAAL